MLFLSSYQQINTTILLRAKERTHIVNEITQTTKGQDEKVNLLNQTSLAWLIVDVQVLLQF